MGDAAKIAHDHAEAVIQRHRDHQAIGRRQAQAFANHVTVVENVVVTEGRALGKTGGARGVLDVHRLVEMQAFLTLAQLFRRHAASQIRQLRPWQETAGRLHIQADHAAQLRQPLAEQFADGLLRQFRHQALHHGVIVRGLEGPGTHQPLAAGLLQHVFEFGTAIRRIDVDQDHADFRGGNLADAPLRTVRRPDAEAVPGLQPQRQQCPGVQVRSLGQLPPGVTQLLMAHHQRLPVRVLCNRVVERLANGHRQQGFVLGTTGVTALRACTGLIHDDPYCLYLWACRDYLWEQPVARGLAPV
ncbi:hypothetical protein D3C84_475640 [compost metagenome]